MQSDAEKIPSQKAILEEPDFKRNADPLLKHDQHFNTDHLLQNLGHRTISAGFITACAQLVKFALDLITSVVLARLLTPNDYGIVAMAGSLMVVLRTFREGGLAPAIIQQQNITQAQVSNLFWINLALGGVVCLLGVALSYPVAWFFRNDQLIAITSSLSLIFLLNGFAAQHVALLNRQMRFTSIAVIDITSMCCGFIAGISFALMGFGYWSLVAMQLSIAASEVLFSWLISGWRPSRPTTNAEMKPLLQFGASLTVFVFLRRVFSGFDVMLLGRLFGTGPVGVYSRGAALLMRPLDQFAAPFDAVFFPVLSRLQSQPQKYKEVFLQAYGSIAMLSFPFAGLLFGVSKPLVLFLLGPKWIEVIPVFLFLTIAALYIPLNYASMWLLTTQGRNRDLMISGVLLPFLSIISAAVGVSFGAAGVALSSSLIGLFIRLPALHYITGRCGPVTTRDLWNQYLLHLPLYFAVAGTSWLAQKASASFSSFAQLSIAGSTGATAAVLVIALWPALRKEAQFLIQRARNFINKSEAKTA